MEESKPSEHARGGAACIQQAYGSRVEHGVSSGRAKNCTLRPQDTIIGSVLLFLIDDRSTKPQNLLKIVPTSQQPSFLGDCITPESFL
jgi:hypothetical protein